ncbi:MAG: 2Fe-2S iron-sulfur cluster-binding protein [Acidimicrobiales bacterium]
MTVAVVNGSSYVLDRITGTLIGWLRGPLGLTGTKPGCGEGECGACTVLVDGQPLLSCQTEVGEVAGRVVTTIEGLAVGGRLHPAQQALVEERASQCGYCTPAMALRIAALVEVDLEPDDSAIARALGPNLCRCGCYARIRRAAYRAAELVRKQDATARPPAGSPVEPAASFDRGQSESGAAADGIDLLPRPLKPWNLVAPNQRDYEAALGPGLVCVWPADEPPDTPARYGGAWIHVAPSGRVTAFSGKVDVGQDNRTAFRLLVAEELEVELGQVTVVQGDTDVCPFDWGTFGSRSMPVSGEALRRAAAGARFALAGPGVVGLLAKGAVSWCWKPSHRSSKRLTGDWWVGRATRLSGWMP